MTVKALYHAHGHATGGRTGAGATDDKKIDVQLSTPKELGGDGGPGTNPEQLFSVGWSACFLGALKYTASQEKVKIPEDATVNTTIGIGPREDGTGFGGHRLPLLARHQGQHPQGTRGRLNLNAPHRPMKGLPSLGLPLHPVFTTFRVA